MTSDTLAVRPASGFEVEQRAFVAALERTPPDALTACDGWTAHELTAHLTAAAVEVALNLEAYGAGRPVPQTRGFEEREAPFRAQSDGHLRASLPDAVDRMHRALAAVLAAEPDAVVPWTGRQMVVKTFITHFRSEMAIHRWDLVGDDETSAELLAQPALTDHAVAVLGRALVARGGRSAAAPFRAAVSTPGTQDVVALVDASGPRLVRADAGSEPAVLGDAGARLLFIWGRKPADPSRLHAPGGAQVLSDLRSLLAGY